MSSLPNWKLRKKKRASSKPCKQHIYFTKEVMPMKMIPLRENKSFVYPSLLVSANRRGKSVVVSSIAFETAFGYCVSCKTGGLAWQ